MSLIRLIAKLHSFLFHPARVAAACATLFFSMLLFNGTFIRLWGLRRDNYQLEQQILFLFLLKTKVYRMNWHNQ